MWRYWTSQSLSLNLSLFSNIWSGTPYDELGMSLLLSRILQLSFAHSFNFTLILFQQIRASQHMGNYVFVVKRFCLSVENLGLYIFLNISMRIYVFEYCIWICHCIPRCWWERVQWLCSVLSMFAQPSTNLYLCRPGEKESWPINKIYLQICLSVQSWLMVLKNTLDLIQG